MSEYERRLAARSHRLEARFGKLGKLIDLVTSPPQTTEAWKRGADGERHVAVRLEELLDTEGVVLLHDRAAPASKANIDHMAIGSGGVTVIDAKNLTGRIRVEWRGHGADRSQRLIVGGSDRTRLVAGLQRQVEMIQAALRDSDFFDVNVVGALCMADAAGMPLVGAMSVQGVAIVGPRGAARIANRPGSISPIGIRRLSAEIEARFPPAVGPDR